MNFGLPRRGREPFDDRPNQLTVHHINELENRIMSALEDAVNDLKAAIASANDRFANVGQLEQTLAEERAKYDALVASEEAEDVAQNQELADAREATNAALAEVQGVAMTLQGLTSQVNTLGQHAEEAENTNSEPSDATPPAEPAPSEAPAETPAEETTPDAPAETPAESTEEETPTLTETPADTGAPTDSQGNPTPMPNV